MPLNAEVGPADVVQKTLSSPILHGGGGGEADGGGGATLPGQEGARPRPLHHAAHGPPPPQAAGEDFGLDSPVASTWLAAASARVAATTLGPHADQIGRVEEVGDGVALVSGLPGVRLDEKLRFAGGQFGFAQVLERGRIGCVLLDGVDSVAAGDAVHATGDVMRVPVGPGLLGRVVDPLGRPLDGKGAISAASLEPIERAAPSIIDRDLVVQPVQTGLLVVDTLFALGRGQRELIIGDRAIGKTTLGIDTIINQKDSDIVCIYVAVGQKSSAVRRAIDAIEAYGDPKRCIVVASDASGSPGLQWIAPFAAMTMAEYFRDRGQHALIVIDDLTKHAATHREIALLTRQSPGREAYPGDVFYVHARLLERAAKLSKEKGGGSLTALPIAETDAGNLSAYIPTNLISITDGQIVLDAKLFHQGQKPAVDVGTSVSRVGGKTQAVALRDAAKTLRLDYAQFLELESFTRFGGMPDARVQRQLTRGACIRAILEQPQHAPLRLADEVALVSAVQAGLLDGMTKPAIAAFRLGLRQAIDTEAAASVQHMQASGTLDAQGVQAFTAALKRYAATHADKPAWTERLADVSARITGIRQLGAVVNAMRGIAAARARQARTQLAAVDRYEASIGAAIARALSLLPSAPRAPGSGRLALVLFCAEQGFAGAFSGRVLEAAGPDLACADLFVAGTRGGAALAERRIVPGWQGAMPSHSPGIPKMASAIGAALYARIATGDIHRLEAVFCQWRAGHGVQAVRTVLFPLDPAAFPAPATAAPLLNIAPAALLEALTADYLHAELCRAALHSFAAENEARMEAMAAAHAQTERTLATLQATQRQVRQEEITAEIIELAAGEAASRERAA